MILGVSLLFSALEEPSVIVLFMYKSQDLTLTFRRTLLASQYCYKREVCELNLSTCVTHRADQKSDSRLFSCCQVSFLCLVLSKCHQVVCGIQIPKSSNQVSSPPFGILTNPDTYQNPLSSSVIFVFYFIVQRKQHEIYPLDTGLSVRYSTGDYRYNLVQQSSRTYLFF